MTARRFVLTEVKKVYYNNICGKYYLPNLGRICEKRGHNVPMLLPTFNTTRIFNTAIIQVIHDRQPKIRTLVGKLVPAATAAVDITLKIGRAHV